MNTSENKLAGTTSPPETSARPPTLLPTNPWLALVAAWSVYTAIGAAVGASFRLLSPTSKWLSMATTDVLIVGASLAATLIGGRRLSHIGFRAPGVTPWAKAIGGSIGLGTVATGAVLLSGGSGLRPVFNDLSACANLARAEGHHPNTFSAPWFVLTWMLASLTEEIYCRGWFQTTVGSTYESAPVRVLLPSALLFGALHLNLLFAGVDLLSVAILLPSVTALGLLAAWVRARSGSLYPAIAAHVGFNVGGMLCGIVYTVVSSIATGRLPSEPR